MPQKRQGDGSRRGQSRSGEKKVPGLQLDLQFRHSLGIGNQVRNNIFLLGENSLMFSSGMQVCTMNLKSKRTVFFRMARSARRIICMALSSNKKHLAVCESMSTEEGDFQGKAQVSIFHLALRKRVRTLSLPARADFTAVCFSNDGKHLFTQCDSPDNGLAYWKWETERVLASNVGVGKVTNISSHPSKPGIAITSGPRLLRMWRLSESNALTAKQILPQKKESMDIFSDHGWTSEGRLVVVTEQSDILIFQSVTNGTDEMLEHVQTINCGSTRENPIRLESFVASPKGFIVAGSHGYLSVFERTDNLDVPYLNIKAFQGDKKHQILALGLPPSCDKIICCTKSRQLIQFPLARLDLLHEGKNHFTPLLTFGNCDGRVVATDICLFRPVVVTVGSDRVVRAFNYSTNEGELTSTVSDEPVALSCHPGGCFLVVAFREKIRVYNIYMDGLRKLREIILKNVNDVKFSNGGHLFAVASGITIYLYDTYNMKLLRTFDGHIGTVTQVYFTKHDRALVSCGLDGCALAWRLDGFQYDRIESLCASISTTQFLDVAVDSTLARALICGSNSQLYEIFDGKVTAQVMVLRQCPVAVVDEEEHDNNANVNDESNEAAPPSVSQDDEALAAEHFTDNENTIDAESISEGLLGEIPIHNGSISSGINDLATKHNGMVDLGVTEEDPDSTSVHGGMLTTKGDDGAGLGTFNRNVGNSTRSLHEDTLETSVSVWANVEERDEIYATCAVIDVNDQFLIVGTSAGTVRAYRWPLSQYGGRHCAEWHCHEGGVSSMRLSSNGNMLVSGGEDGSTFILDVTTLLDGSRVVRDDRGGVVVKERVFQDDAVLVSRGEMNDKNDQIENTSKELDDLRAETEYMLHAKDSEWKERTKVLREDSDYVLHQERGRYDQLQKRLQDNRRSHIEQIELKDVEMVKARRTIENEYERKLARELDRLDNQAEEMEQTRQRCESLLNAQERQHRKEMDESSTRALDKIKELGDQSAAQQSELKFNEQRFDEVHRQQEQEYELEIVRLKKDNHRDVEHERQVSAVKQNQLTQQRNRNVSLKTKMTEMKAAKLVGDTQIADLVERNEKLQVTLQLYERNLEEREIALTNKEKTILGLRSSNQTLDNFRYVLDHRIEKLTAEKGPIKDHIKKLEDHIRAMYNEMVLEYQVKKQLDRQMAMKDSKVDSLAGEVRKLRMTNREKDNRIATLLLDIANTARLVDPKAAQDRVRHLHAAYIVDDEKERKQSIIAKQRPKMSNNSNDNKKKNNNKAKDKQTSDKSDDNTKSDGNNGNGDNLDSDCDDGTGNDTFNRNHRKQSDSIANDIEALIASMNPERKNESFTVSEGRRSIVERTGSVEYKGVVEKGVKTQTGTYANEIVSARGSTERPASSQPNASYRAATAPSVHQGTMLRVTPSSGTATNNNRMLDEWKKTISNSSSKKVQLTNSADAGVGDSPNSHAVHAAAQAAIEAALEAATAAVGGPGAQDSDARAAAAAGLLDAAKTIMETGMAGSPGENSNSDVNSESQTETIRQRDSMVKTITTLKRTLVIADRKLKDNTKRSMHENSLLISECNNLRREIVQQKQKIQEMEERGLDVDRQFQRTRRLLDEATSLVDTYNSSGTNMNVNSHGRNVHSRTSNNSSTNDDLRGPETLTEQELLVANGFGLMDADRGPIEVNRGTDNTHQSTTPILVKLRPQDSRNTCDSNQRQHRDIHAVTRWTELGEDSIFSVQSSVAGKGTRSQSRGGEGDKLYRGKSQQQQKLRRGGPDFETHVDYGQVHRNNNQGILSPSFSMSMQVVPTHISMSSKKHMSVRPHTSTGTSGGRSRARTVGAKRRGNKGGIRTSATREGDGVMTLTATTKHELEQQALIMELTQQLEDNNREVNMQRIEISRLRDQVQMLMSQVGTLGEASVAIAVLPSL